jgi:DNA gyrase subunit A
MSKEEPTEERIVDIDLSKEMQDSFLEYSYSVIYARALPDARDGLKPVHRRIIYQMGEMGLRPEKGHVKSARVVGEVMGKLHPHGDSAIYDALVRMAQSFSLRVPLIDGHGNFGSLDDGPAASRYTEAKLSIASILMNDGLDEDVVDYKPNYDAQLTEPEVLPAAFPNLLVNGSSGIAVGMATNMPPHNLREVINGAVYLLANPEATTKQLMKFIPGPDLPNGGIIIGLDGVIEAYDTGRGTFKTRARVSIESVSPRKQGIVITELPYLIGPEKVIEKIKDGVNSKKLQGISDVTDLTDRTNGLRLVIELKTGYDPQTVLDLLYRFTPMEDSFGINNVALVDGRPQTLGLKDMLGVYLAHRIVVTRRRSENRLGKKQARLHLVEGLLIAIVSIDEVIQVIRTSDEVDQARQKLMKVFDLSELQAEYILELRLRRLTKFSKIELETEKETLLKEIKSLKKILGSPAELRDVVSSELEEVAKKYGDDRRTTLMSTFEEIKPISNAKAANMSAQLADTPCVIVFTASGMVGKASVWDTAAAAPVKRKKHDAIKTVIATTTRSDIGFLTTTGVMHRIHVGDVPALNDVFDLSSMVAASSFLGLPKSEKVLNVFELNEKINIAMGTAKGVVKRLSADFPQKAEFEVISMKTGDKLVGANLVEDEDEIVFVTNDAQLLRFSASVLNAQGRGAAGIAGINLSSSEVVAFSVVKAENENIVVTAASSSGSLAGTDAGSVKISELGEFPPKGRATGGVRAHKFLRNEDQIYFAWAGPIEAIALTADGKPTDLPEALAKRDASGTKSSGIIGSVGHRLN